jgi:hypothetical protein
VRRWTGLLLLLAGCSGLTETEGGVVGLEVRVPGPDTVEVGESIQLSARPLDKNGDSVGVPVTWVSADTTATVDADGVLTGVATGSARVQATVGSLSSPLITFAVIARADSLVLPADSIFTVPLDTTAGPPMVTRLDSFNPAGPLAGRRVIYAITLPDPTSGTPTVTLKNGGVADTILTGADGLAADTLRVVPGLTPPESLVVEVGARRTRGDVVPGSGQRFIVRFQ